MRMWMRVLRRPWVLGRASGQMGYSQPGAQGLPSLQFNQPRTLPMIISSVPTVGNKTALSLMYFYFHNSFVET